MNEHEIRVSDLPQLVVDRSPELLRSTDCEDQPPPGATVMNFPADVAGSVRGDGGRCVLAQALLVAWPGCEPHIEGEHPYMILASGKRIEVKLSRYTAEQVGRFDRGESDAFDGITIGIWAS
jgi:hypothetical protein